MSRPRLLVTGFTAFPGARCNPTEALVADLPGGRLARRYDIDLATTILPTEYAAVADLLPRLWRELAPDAVIHFGLHGRARAVHVERRALNHMSPVRPDAARRRPESPQIVAQGPAAPSTTLPADFIVAALARRGVPVRLSRDAGRYVCNYASYLSLQLAPPGAMTGFIHLPWPAEERAPQAPAGRPDRAVLRIAVEEVIGRTAIAARARRRAR